LIFYQYTSDFENLLEYDDTTHNVILTHMLDLENIITSLEDNASKLLGLERFCDASESHAKFSLFDLQEF
jgi:hypothetical protein